MRDRVAFDAPSVQPDGYGGQEAGWTPRGQRPAKFVHVRGNETVDAARLSGQEVYRLCVRQSPMTREIATGWRVRDLNRGTEYNIRSVDAVTDRRFVWMQIESGVAV